MKENLRSVAVDLLACFNAWEPEVRVLGNVRACDGAALIEAILAVPACDKCNHLENTMQVYARENAQQREELDGFAKMYALLGEEKDQAQRWLKEREQMLSDRDKDCELATSILRGAISALHSMHDPIQANARQQIQMAIDVLCKGSTVSAEA